MKRPINQFDIDEETCKKVKILPFNNNNNNNNGGTDDQDHKVFPGQQQGGLQMLEESNIMEDNQLTEKGENNNTEDNGQTKKVKLNNGDSVVNNGGVVGDDGADLSDMKAMPASRVVHIRNIPSDVSETEIVHLGIPFGRVSNVLVLKGKNQAFLELAEESAAIAMVSYFTNCVAQLRGRSVYVQFSTHKELKTDQSHSNANSAAQAALQAAQALNNIQGPHSQVNQHLNQNLSESLSTQGGPNTVLRVIIEQMLYPVTLDVLFQIFSRVGKVLRIVTFTKNGFFQALIQYPDVVMAQAAKLTLDGQNIYNGCCTLRIEYSKLSSLNVRYNNDKSRDYTNPNLPTGEPSNQQQQDVAALFGIQHQNGLFGQQQQQIAAAILAGNSQNGTNNQQQQQGFLAAMQLAAASNGHHGGHSGQQMLRQHTGHHHPHPHHHHHHGGILAAMNAAAGSGMAMQLNLAGIQQNNLLPGCVLLVSNLNEDLITPDGLFTLFGVYGDVQRVKILFNKKDSALVQMREPAQAQLALTYLDRLKLQTKIVRVTLSKHGLVQMPKEGQPDAGLTKDYTNSPLHRFKKPDSKNYQNIYPPSATLHLSNIPASVTEEEILQAFDSFNVKGFKFFPKDRKMALLQLPSIEEAAESLMKMHNYQLRENSHLRVSFSKSTI